MLPSKINRILFFLTALALLSGCASQRPLLTRGWIGGEYKNAKAPLFKLPPSLADKKGNLDSLPGKVKKTQSGAVLVTRVTENSPLGLAGVKEGDLIVGLYNKKITKVSSLRKIIDSVIPGQPVVLTLYRNGALTDIPVTVGSETYKKLKYLYLGFRLGPDIDIIPNPDFSIFSLVSYKSNSSRVLLDSPEGKYTAQNQKDGEPQNNPVWDVWLGIIGFGGSESVISQKMIEVKK